MKNPRHLVAGTGKSLESAAVLARRGEVRLWSILVTGLLLGCTGVEDPLDIELEQLEPDQLEPAAELEFLVVPSRIEADPPPAFLEPPPTPAPTPPRWEMWRVLEDVDDWLRLEIDEDACDLDLPKFPTVSADGDMLALALVSAPVADERVLTIRFLRRTDAKQMRAHTLLGPGESELPPEELQRRVCHRAKALARALSGHTPMPVVGGWDNPTSDGLPDRVDGWPRVFSDGATREVDATVADVVIAPANADAPELVLRAAGPKSCAGSSEQFSKVWEAAGLRVFTRGPCGC